VTSVINSLSLSLYLNINPNSCSSIGMTEHKSTSIYFFLAKIAGFPYIRRMKKLSKIIKKS
jgi:hypothetical protein